MSDGQAPRWPRWHGQQAAPNVTPDPRSVVEEHLAAQIAEAHQRTFLARVTGYLVRWPWHSGS